MERREAKNTLLKARDLDFDEIYRRKSSSRPGTLVFFPRSRHQQPGPLRPRKRPQRLPNLLVFIAILAVTALIYNRFVSSNRIDRRLALPILDDSSAYKAALPELSPEEDNVVSHISRPGDDMGTIGRRFGISPQDIAAINRSLTALGKEEAERTAIIPGKRVELAFDQFGKLQRVAFKIGTAKEVIVNRIENGFEPGLIREPAEDLEHVAMGEVKTSFAAAAVKAGIPYHLIDALVDIFSDRLEFNKDLHAGDRFTLIYRNEPVGKKGKKEQILAAAIDVNGETLIATRYVGTDGKARYFDGEGKLLGDTFLRYPLKFTSITSYVTDSRFHPVLHINRPHNGVDFAAPVGTPVRSVASGRVVFAGYKGPNGNMVLIRHSDRYTTAYLHLSSISADMRKGAAVAKGQVIGGVGTSGLSTGPHLHFSLFDHGTYVNPLTVKLPIAEDLSGGNAIRKKYLNRVVYTLEHYQNVDLQRQQG